MCITSVLVIKPIIQCCTYCLCNFMSLKEAKKKKKQVYLLSCFTLTYLFTFIPSSFRFFLCIWVPNLSCLCFTYLLCFLTFFCWCVFYIGASLVAQSVKKNPPALQETACTARDMGSIPGLERSPGEGNGKLLQCSWLKNPRDRGDG